MAEVKNVIIVGSGPAGYTAALYTARANLNPLVFEGFLWGGLLQQTTEVENFPGFRDGIQGPALMQTMRDQAERFGTRFVTDVVEKVELAEQEGGIHRVWVDGEVHEARTVILAMGAEHKKLGVPGEDELGGRGVSYCATCDAAFFKDKHIAVIGGGDSAMEEAIFLAKFGAKVSIVNRREEFRASRIMLDRAKAEANIEWVAPYRVEAFEDAGTPGVLPSLRLTHAVTDEQLVLEDVGSFIAIGHEPQSEVVHGQVSIDDEGYVITQGRSTRTDRPGVFAAGDLVDHTYRQAITAAGSGCQAALDAEWYLRDTPAVPTPAGMPVGDLAEAQWTSGAATQDPAQVSP